MSHRGSGTFPEDKAKTTTSAADGAANFPQRPSDDLRLLGLIDAWPMLSEDARDAVARLVGDDSHDIDDVTAVAGGKAVSR